MNSIEVPIQQLCESIEVPAYAYPGDAGLDLRAAQSLSLAPFERALIPVGIALSIPSGYAGFVLPRSGLAIKSGLSLVNAPGLIDSNYRGEIKIIAINLDPKETITVQQNDRVAQLVIMPVPVVTLVSRNSLDESVRGKGGFGSSGR